MSKLQLRVFDGTRQLFSAPAKFLVTVTDGNRTQQVRDYYQANDIIFDLPFFDNFGDNYAVVVWAKGYKQAGFVPVTLSDQYLKTLDIMLIPDNPGFRFVDARWDAARARYPLLGSDVDNPTGAARYDNLLDQTPKSLACLLNIFEAMSQIALSQGTPLDYTNSSAGMRLTRRRRIAFMRGAIPFSSTKSRMPPQLVSSPSKTIRASSIPALPPVGSRSSSVKPTSSSPSMRTTRWSSGELTASW